MDYNRFILTCATLAHNTWRQKIPSHMSVPRSESHDVKYKYYGIGERVTQLEELNSNGWAELVGSSVVLLSSGFLHYFYLCLW